MQTAFASDLVRDSKLKATLNGDTTRHVIEIAGRSARQRKIQKEQLWKRAENLGQGTFGSVWLEKLVGGESVVSERAVKVIKKQVQKSKAVDYSRELEAIAKFSHPKYNFCFVESFGWFESESYVYIAMEYFPLGDLQAYLSTSLLENEVQQICFQILEGLESMHLNGFAHRDLKPSNILVKSCSPDWWVKIGDFGISKRAVEGLTALRSFSGTLGFLAPEILIHHGLLDCEEFGEQLDYTVAVDLWSLGEIVFRALTNEPPFRRGLASYIKGTSSFPYGVLQAHKVSSEGCDILRNLLRPIPTDRLTAEAALNHPWIASQQKSSPRSSAESQRPQLNATGIPSKLSGMADLDENDSPLSVASAVWSTVQTDTVGGRCGADIQQETPAKSRTSKEMLPESQFVPPESLLEIHSSAEVETAHDDKVKDHHGNASGQFSLREIASGQYLAEGYVSHHELEDLGKLVVMTSKSIVMVRKEDLTVQWDLLLENVRTIIKDRTGLVFWLRRGIQGPYILGGDQQSIDTLWKQVTVAVHAYSEEHSATVAEESDTKLVLWPMPQNSPDGVLDPSMVQRTYRSPDTDGNSSDITLRPMASHFAGRKRLPSSIQEAPWSPVDHLDLVEQDQNLETEVGIRQAQGSSWHDVDKLDGSHPAKETNTWRNKSLGQSRRESIQARRARREQAKEANTLENVDTELEHAPSGANRNREVKPVFLKGLFSVSTTSSKPLSYIQNDIIRVLDRLGVEWEEIKGGFKCRHAPSIDLHKAVDLPASLPSGRNRRRISVGKLESGHLGRYDYTDTDDSDASDVLYDRQPRSERPLPAGGTSTHFQNDMGGNMNLNFDMLIVKVPLLSLHGIQFRKVDGGTWQYKNMAQTILSVLRL